MQPGNNVMTMTKNNRLYHALILILILANAQLVAQQPALMTGLEVAAEHDFAFLKGKRVGLITNATGVNSKLVSTIDILNLSSNVNLVALYGPEHGVRGDYSAGEKVGTYVDEATGIPVFSLYGSTRKPTKEMLEGVDVLVFDIQDIGSRSYTYISTMGLAMEAAAENNIEFVVFDRPNPLGGNRVEGNLTEDGFYSFVSQFEIPYVHGLTVGELANLLNYEGYLTDGKSCKLTVIRMNGWKRSMDFSETGLPWVPTSPHIPHSDSPLFYTSTGVLGELRFVSEGVGYTTPFQNLAAEWIDAAEFAFEMNALKLDGVIFRPLSMKPYYAAFEGKKLQGVQIHFTDPSKVNLLTIQFYAMQVLHQLYPQYNPFEEANPSRVSMFDKVMGTDRVRKAFAKRFLVSDILSILNEDLGDFKAVSFKYHLYD